MSESAETDVVDPMLLERIELAFPELVGGFEVLERDLRFDGRTVADFMAYSQGRVLLVSVVDGGDDTCALRALDALAFARSQDEIIESALPDGLECEEGARVILVSPGGFSAKQFERLAVLRDQGLWLLRKRELRTKRGTHTRLEPIDVSDGRTTQRPVDLPAWAVAEPFRSFLALIAPDRLELAISSVGRLRRIDPGLEWSFEQGRLICGLDGAELCRAIWVDGHLELSREEDAPGVPIRDDATIDQLVDEVLADYLLRLRASTPGLPTRSASARPAIRRNPDLIPVIETSVERSAERKELSERFDEDDSSPFDSEPVDEFPQDDDDLDQVELRPLAPGPLLTREEIEAFQE